MTGNMIEIDFRDIMSAMQHLSKNKAISHDHLSDSIWNIKRYQKHKGKAFDENLDKEDEQKQNLNLRRL